MQTVTGSDQKGKKVGYSCKPHEESCYLRV